ncbi:MAG: hypothetical protein M3Y72_27665, partial [Acidobacteriota bacterium]|nr:hypothetical protein [Acidobacteriota bacterium]
TAQSRKVEELKAELNSKQDSFKQTEARIRAEADANLRAQVTAVSQEAQQRKEAELVLAQRQLEGKQQEIEALRREYTDTQRKADAVQHELEILRWEHAEARDKASAALDARDRAQTQKAAETESRVRLETQTTIWKTAAQAAESQATEIRSQLDRETARRTKTESDHETVVTELSKLRRELKDLKHELGRSKDEQAALLNSRSWRLTAPLRKITRRPSDSANNAGLDGVELPISLPQKDEQPQNAQLLLQNSLFDSSWYLEHYPDVAEAGLDPVVHYLEYGASECRDPGPDFDASWYLEQYPDVAQAGANPLLHYLQSGLKEGRGIRPIITQEQPRVADPELSIHIELIKQSALFDVAWYLEQYPDIAAVGIDPAEHYLRHGALEGRNPGPIFNTIWYVERHPDLQDSGENALVHFLEHKEVGDKELLRQARLISDSDLFDADWYRKRCPEIATAGGQPVWHYVISGAADGRNPGRDFDAKWYLKAYSDVANGKLNPLVHYLEHGALEERQIRPVALSETLGVPALKDLLQAKSGQLALKAFIVPPGPSRVTLVTDSINAGSLYGGVGTALLLSACLASRLGASLRLVTRGQAPEKVDVIGKLLLINDISWSGNLEIIHAPHTGDREIPISVNDLFLTTSWWTTRCVRGVVPPSRIIYLLQEDERMFYPFGDERLRCEEMLSDSEINFVINSRLLFEHLTTGPDFLPGVKKQGVWFEPAFPYSNYHAGLCSRRNPGKRNFFFYARPLNLRNLYWRGLEAISAAIEAGVFEGEDWDFYFVGHSLEKFVLPNGREPITLENLPWAEYGSLVRKMDAGLCLMDTPHPSYPPLDLAASGAVVVTNRRGLKTSLSQYSENILCVEPTVRGLEQGIREAVILANNENNRLGNYATSGLLRDWNIALEPVLQHLAGLFPKQKS